MSHQRDRLMRVAADLGLEVQSIEWRPIRMGAEKSGADGGWEVWGRDWIACGLNVDDTIADLRFTAEHRPASHPEGER